jgi:hypothetical protein
MDLERGVRALHRGIVRLQIERIVPVDADVERSVAQAAQPGRQRPVARQIGDRARAEVGPSKGRQDADRHDAGAARGRASAYEPHRSVNVLAQGGKGATQKRRRGRAELDVERAHLGRDEGAVGGVRDLLSETHGTRLSIDEEELDLGADASRSLAEAGPPQHAVEHAEVFLEPLPKADEVGIVEAIALNLGAHGSCSRLR